MPLYVNGRTQIVDRMLALHHKGRLGQSWLFTGPDGSGKEITALEIARRINCATPQICTVKPSCESCHKAATFQHPDIRWLGPAPASLKDSEVRHLLEAKQEDPFFRPAYASSSEVLIGDVDNPGPLSVRAVLQFLRLRPFQGSHKVVIISDAHRLRSGAANAFLKMLEEPPQDALIMLLSSMRSSILPTILSRCQQVNFEIYGRDELCRLLTSVYGLAETEASRLATASAGDARRATRMILPEPRILRTWSRQLFEAIHRGSRSTGHIAAEMLHKGVLPADLVAGETDENRKGPSLKTAPLKDLAARRERAIQLCELLHLHYSGLLGCLSLGDAWSAPFPEDTQGTRGLATGRSPMGVIRDIQRIDDARSDIDHYLNIGLMMSLLFQELIDHAKQEAMASRV